MKNSALKKEERRQRNTEVQASLRARRRELGYKLVQFWVHEDDLAAVEAMLEQQRITRGDF